MYLPQLNNIPNDRSMINAFYGYNSSPDIRESQFCDTYNMTSDYYPLMSPRDKRGIIKYINKANGMYAAAGLIYVDGSRLFFGGEEICEVEDSKKSFVRMGAYICIFPDKIMYNTYDGTIKNMENRYTTSGTVVFEPCSLSGEAVEYASEEPDEPKDGEYWLDGDSLKRWSGTYNMWMPVAASYIRISERTDGVLNEHFADGFNDDDTVNISGCTKEDFNGDNLVYKSSGAYIVIAALSSGITQTEPLTISREVPDMDYVCELNNRLWGCSSEKHEIYSCKLGDPTNWKNYAGLNSDSYAVTVGSAGDFTGCVAHLGYVLFFKENCMHRIYGTLPSNFSVLTTECRGVEKGSEKSLCVLNEVLYYKSRDGICMYDGSVPRNISHDLGFKQYHNAAAGAYRNKYMISMQDENYVWHIFVYDADRGIWMHEDNEEILYFANDEGALYCMMDDRIMLIQKEYMDGIYPGMDIYYEGELTGLYPGMFYPGQEYRGYFEDDLRWYAETGDIGTEYPDNKYISKIILRLSVAEKALFNVDIQYDSDGVWDRVLSVRQTLKRSVTIPVKIRRCDHIRLKFSGKGDCKLYSVTRNIEQGSEI